MPQVNLPYALRYFFSPIIAYVYLYILSPTFAAQFLHELGAAAIVMFITAGCALYFVYRFAIYEALIAPLQDWTTPGNYRNFIKNAYNISSTRKAILLRDIISDDHFGHGTPGARQIRSAGIHLLYQASILAVPFLVASIFLNVAYLSVIVLTACLVVFSTAAFWMDRVFEQEETLYLRHSLEEPSNKEKMDQAARLL